jgi:hypothetical protein
MRHVLTTLACLFLFVLPASAQQKPFWKDKDYYIASGAHIGMAAADYKLSKDAIATGQFREGNPIVAKSQGGISGPKYWALVAISQGASTALWHFQGKKKGLIGLCVGVGVHGVGVGVALSY